MQYFFDNGLRFSCQQCGNCCVIPDGYVFVHPSEIKKIYEFLNIPLEEFSRLYLEKLDGEIVLKSYPNGECIFWDKKVGCKIYDVRPRQCVTFPFWPHVLHAKSEWELTATDCPGINKGRTWTKDEIIAQVHEKLRKD